MDILFGSNRCHLNIFGDFRRRSAGIGIYTKMLRAMQSDLIAQIAAEKNSTLMDDTYVAIFDGR